MNYEKVLFKNAGIAGRVGNGLLGGGRALLNEARAGADTTGKMAYSLVKNRGLGNGTTKRQLGRAAGLLGRMYKAPYTFAKGVASGMGASNRAAQAIGLGALGTAFYGRQMAREGGPVDLFNLSSDFDMLTNPIRDAWNLAGWGLGHFHSGSPATVSPEAAAANSANSPATDAVASTAGSSDAERVRRMNRAQNFGTTATPVA